MAMIHTERGFTLIQKVEDHVRQTTHGRVRDLAVNEEHGQLVIRGQTASHHTRQLALHAAMELLASEQFRTCITVC